MGRVRTLTSEAPSFPVRLRDLCDCPDPVYVRGALPDPESPRVGIVGARRASCDGGAFARVLGRAAAEAGAWVISGGAMGIDAAAHDGAIDAAGRTLAVFANPVTAPGPRANRALFERILAANGGWLSERDRPPARSAFRDRNRLIAALSDLVVVVEGRAQSGTRHTLEAARSLGRPVAAVTWAPGDPRGAQAEWVFEVGGRPIARPEHLCAALGLRWRPKTTVVEPPPISTSEGSAADALARLTDLELEGRVESLGGGRFRAR